MSKLKEMNLNSLLHSHMRKPAIYTVAKQVHSPYSSVHSLPETIPVQWKKLITKFKKEEL